MLIALINISGHSAHIVAVCLRIIIDGLRTFWPSDSVRPGPPIIQVHNGQIKHSDLIASIVDIQRKISDELQILYSKDTKAHRKRSSIA